MAGVFDLDALPQELLERVLAWLPIADLVVLRAVCRRWRAAIAQLAAADAPFAFQCGWPDLGQNTSWLQRLHARTLANPMYGEYGAEAAEEAGSDVVYAVMGVLENLGSLPCTCGGLWTLNDDNLMNNVRHSARFLPARWALLVPERDLAFSVSALVSTQFMHFKVLDLIRSDRSVGRRGLNAWMPAWFHLPTDVRRPSNALELHALGRAMIDEYVPPGEQPLVAKMADPAFARSFYARAATDSTENVEGSYQRRLQTSDTSDWENAASWTDVMFLDDRVRGPGVGPNDDRNELYLEHHGDFEALTFAIRDELPLFAAASERLRERDPTGLDRWRLEARQSAAAWRICSALNWTPWLNAMSYRIGFSSIQSDLQKRGVDTNDATAVQAYLDDQVAEIDRAVIEIRRLLRHAIVFHGDPYDRHPLWLLGLSKGGHLVGAVTHFDPNTD